MPNEISQEWLKCVREDAEQAIFYDHAALPPPEPSIHVDARELIALLDANANLQTLVDVLGEQQSEIKYSLERGKIPVQGSYAATVNLLVDDYEKLLADVVALRFGINQAVHNIEHNGQAALAHATLVHLLATTNPGAGVLRVVEAAREVIERFSTRAIESADEKTQLHIIEVNESVWQRFDKAVHALNNGDSEPSNLGNLLSAARQLEKVWGTDLLSIQIEAGNAVCEAIRKVDNKPE